MGRGKKLNKIREIMFKTLSKTASILPSISRVIPATRSLCQSYGFLSRKYSKEHEWITVENGIGTIGISDFVAPVSGAVIEVNENLEETPDLVNKDPLGEGWIMKVKLSDESELSGLMDEESYTTFCDEQES